ncbi:MAG TPA: hypothetical protein VKE96_12300 [Vicinamibacterales bacterium]|nr:hypothetical protein [Vicinamibacterales bacterium]
MSSVRSADFDIAALHGALDAERQARGLSWPQLAREISAPFRRLRPISPSTLSGMRSHRAIEGDGVLQMLRWLNRAPESFVPGEPGVPPQPAMLPDVGPTQILRFDTRQIYAMLDAQRAERALTWAQVAREIGDVSAAGLTRYANGGRTGFPQVTRIAAWLEVPVASLTRGFHW